MDNSIEDESDSDYFDDQESGSETEDGESQTSEDDDEIDLEDLILNDDSTRKSLYSSGSGMTWASIPHRLTKTNSSNNTIEKAGPTKITEDVSSIEDAFICFMSEKITQKILIYSNMECTRNIASNEKPQAITMMELKAFIGLLLLAGLLGQSKRNITCLWRRNPLESPIFKATMARSRFQKIISCLRFDDKTTREERKRTDKFAAIREIWSYFQGNLKTCYTPGSNVTIDEQLLGFRGKCPFRQYIPKKPDRYGLKLWLCVDVDSHYVFNAFPYIGRQPNQQRQIQIGTKVVLELLRPLYGSNRNVTIDNFFTSVPLAKELQTKNLTLIGTLRKNKPEIPMEFQSNKNREAGSSLFGFQDDLTLVSFVPKQNKAVLLLSSKHHDSQVDNKTGKPIIILDYNKTKGAVDTVDQMCHKYTVKRGTKRWPLCIFYGMVNVAAINALIVWKAKNAQWNRNKRYQRRLFLEELGLSLVSHLLDFRSKTSKFLNKDIQNALAIVGYPVTEKNPSEPNENSTQSKRKRCSICERSMDKKTSTKCSIARALIRDPKILLLDEATSALDNESENIVQEALHRAAENRTTIIIAHRLSTIRNADKIIVMHKGEVVEEGVHDSLMKAQGRYFTLVEQQSLRQVEEEEQLIFEEQEATKMFLSEQSNLDHSNATKHRSSTIISLAPSILAELYGKKNPIVNDHLKKENDDENTRTTKNRKQNITLAILRMNKPEWIFIVVGCVAALFNGALEPMFAIARTKMTVVFRECDKDAQNRHILFYILLSVGLGILGLIFQSLQGTMFAYSGGNLTKRLRSKVFRAILRQDITYFDQAEHNIGALCTHLATEASAVQGASGVRFGLFFQNLVSVSVGIIIGFVFSWQLTLVIIAFIPLVIFGGYAQIRITARSQDKDKTFVEDAGKVAVETIQNIRTVFQLTNEAYFYKEYCRLLDILYRSSLKQAHVSALLFAVVTATLTFASTAVISLGTTLITQNTITFEDMYMTFNSVAITAAVVGQTLILSPDYGKATEAAAKIFKLLKRKPAINHESKDGDKISDLTGQLDFNNVYFIYPNRPESIILNNFKLSIKAGQKVALVGTSGSGKSTIFQLMERFYEAKVGQLLVDSKDIRSLNLQWYRSQIGIVSQEPILFNISIRENIAYGDNSRTNIPLDEIMEAAKNANIHDFIQHLPDGYETICGEKAVQLSGGQKQRIAIARALIRNPKILLLDEATSALDSESEKIVQEALDRAQQNRTSITIAHRLSTIQNSDLICIIHNGRITEHGTHKELLALGGRYYRLVQGKLK